MPKAPQPAKNAVKSRLKALLGVQEVLPAAEREANQANFLADSAVKSRLYHGTKAHDDYEDQPGQAFEQFTGRPTWLAQEPYTASGYSGSTGSTYPVFAQIKKPLNLTFDANDDANKALETAKLLGVDVDHIKRMSKPEKAWEVINHPEFIDAVEKAGYDGLAINEGGYKTFGLLDPRKIKSAIGNRGTYDINNPDITKAGGGALKSKAKQAIKGALESVTPAVNRIDMSYKDVTKRVPELTEGAQAVSRGDMSADEYDRLVKRVKPVTPYGFVPEPATTEDAMRALTENKRPMFGKVEEIQPGEQADLRLDIPAYRDHGVWVNSIHRKNAPTVYGSTSSVKNATMIGAPEKALRVATGETPKAPFAVIRGDWNPMSEAESVDAAKQYLNHPDWRQVGYDPERHGYFYDRQTMEPILGAEEVIQIGPLVLAKKPRYGKKGEQKYAGGGALKDGDVKMGRGGPPPAAKLTIKRKLKTLLGMTDEAEDIKPIGKSSESESVTAAQRAEAGRRAADVNKAIAPMKMSEALGNMNVEGKGALKVTQSDRTRVGGGNIGGAMFPGLQQVDPFYEGAVWGVGNKPTASGLINQSDESTLWTTLLGSADQLKTNPIVFNKLRRGFTDAMKAGKLSDELADKINHNLALKFGEGADIRDPKIWRKADTFDKRALLADLMMGQGIAPGKGGVALGGEKSGKGVIFQPSEILKKETEPLLLHPEYGGDVPTFAVGPRLFSLSGDVKNRPDLHPGFPYILQGEDKGVVFRPAPGEVAMREYVKRFKEKNKRNPGYYDWTLGEKGVGLPSQPITEEYLTYLQRAGYKNGGSVGALSRVKR